MLRHLSCVNFSDVRVGRVFHSASCFGLEGLSFLHQFLDAFGVCLGNIGQSLGVAGLAG